MPRLTPQPARKLIRVFEWFGFEVSKRRPGDHIAMRKSGCLRPLIIPDDNEVPVFIILNNLRSARISREEYLAKLADI